MTDSEVQVVAAAWVCVRDRRMLVVRSRDHEAFFLPGGTPELGETLAQTAIREVAEEVGVVLAPESLRPLIEVVAPAYGKPGNVRLVCFTAPSDEAPQAAAEISEVAWFTTADSERCAPALRPVLSLLSERGAID